MPGQGLCFHESTIQSSSRTTIKELKSGGGQKAVTTNATTTTTTGTMTMPSTSAIKIDGVDGKKPSKSSKGRAGRKSRTRMDIQRTVLFGEDETVSTTGIENSQNHNGRDKFRPLKKSKSVRMGGSDQNHNGHRGEDGEGYVKVTWAVLLFTACASINSCNLGYDVGVNTNVGPLLQERFLLSDLQLGLFLGGLNIFAMVGALAVHYFSDRYGRRYSFTVAAILVAFGSLASACSQGYGGLMFGRVFVGLGVGFGLALDPMYISEIAPAAHRGALVTWANVALNMGVILGFLSGIVFAGIDDAVQWRYMLGAGAFLPLVMIVLSIFVMPESPRWLVQKQQHDKAAEVVQRIYGEDFEVGPIILEIQSAIQREEISNRRLGWDMIFSPSPALRRMLIVGLGMAIAQQAVGIDAIQYFLVFILEDSGLKRGTLQSWVLLGLGMIKMVFIVDGGFLVDRYGRRPLYLVSVAGMAVSLLMLSVNFASDNSSSLFAIFALALYLAMFSLGMGPGAWLTSSEIFSTVIRAKAMSVATFLNRVVSTLMSSTFLSTAHAVSWPVFFLMLAVVCIIILVFLYVFLPETKGRSLEDMSVYFAEITGDRSMLEAEAKIKRDRLARDLSYGRNLLDASEFHEVAL